MFEKNGMRDPFSLKSFAIADALSLMTSSLNGFSVSSLFGETLQEDVMGTTGTVHMVTPGYKPTEMDEIAQITDRISFNSLSQWDRFSRRASQQASCGLRINPQLSFVEDKRYNLAENIPSWEFRSHNSKALERITGFTTKYRVSTSTRTATLKPTGHCSQL